MPPGTSVPPLQCQPPLWFASQASKAEKDIFFSVRAARDDPNLPGDSGETYPFPKWSGWRFNPRFEPSGHLSTVNITILK